MQFKVSASSSSRYILWVPGSMSFPRHFPLPCILQNNPIYYYINPEYSFLLQQSKEKMQIFSELLKNICSIFVHTNFQVRLENTLTMHSFLSYWSCKQMQSLQYHSLIFVQFFTYKFTSQIKRLSFDRIIINFSFKWLEAAVWIQIWKFGSCISDNFLLKSKLEIKFWMDFKCYQMRIVWYFLIDYKHFTLLLGLTGQISALRDLLKTATKNDIDQKIFFSVFPY